MEGRSGRTGWMLTGLLWVLAIGCKEDAVLLPAYTLALELTLLRFAAAEPGLARRLRRTYLFATVAGALAYFLIRSEEHTSELQSLMRISYAVFCLKKKKYLTRYLTNTLQNNPDNI